MSWEGSSNCLNYAYKDENGWHPEFADDQHQICIYVGSLTSIALDTGSHPHISYYDETWRRFKYAYKDGDGWHVTTVDDQGSAGMYTSIDL